jgi:hypothetical protein
MALNALGHNDAFILFPVPVRVYVSMAIGAFHILLNMNAGIIFGIFILVTALALDLLHFYLAFDVLGKIGQMDMTAVAAIFTVNGRDKGDGRDLVAVAAQAGDRVDGHPKISPKGISGQQNKQDRGRNAGNHFQHAATPAIQRFEDTGYCKTCCATGSFDMDDLMELHNGQSYVSPNTGGGKKQ